MQAQSTRMTVESMEVFGIGVLDVLPRVTSVKALLRHSLSRVTPWLGDSATDSLD